VARGAELFVVLVVLVLLVLVVVQLLVARRGTSAVRHLGDVPGWSVTYAVTEAGVVRAAKVATGRGVTRGGIW
jgi:hypothetical protein